MHGQTDGWSIWWRWREERWSRDVCNGTRMRCVCSVRCVFAQVMLGVGPSEDDGPPCWRLCCPSRDGEGIPVEPEGNHRTQSLKHKRDLLVWPDHRRCVSTDHVNTQNKKSHTHDGRDGNDWKLMSSLAIRRSSETPSRADLVCVIH